MAIYENPTIEEIISKLDPDFTLESIRKQIDNGIDNTVHTNYLSKFIKMYKAISNEIGKTEETKDLKSKLIEDILRLLMEKFKFELEIDGKLSKLCLTLYEFFVIERANIMANFFEMYIIENSEDVAARINLQSNNVSLNSSKQVLDAPDEVIKIMSSMYDAIDAIANMDIEFEEFLQYVISHDSSDSIAERMLLLINDDAISIPDEMYTIMMAPIINDEDGCGVVINKVNNALYERYVNDDLDTE